VGDLVAERFSPNVERRLVPPPPTSSADSAWYGCVAWEAARYGIVLGKATSFEPRQSVAKPGASAIERPVNRRDYEPPLRMEPLWSPVVATGGNRPQIVQLRKPQKQAKTVGVGCDRLPEPFMVRRGRRFESVRGL
jgi:hypothetical protein